MYFSFRDSSTGHGRHVGFPSGKRSKIQPVIVGSEGQPSLYMCFGLAAQSVEITFDSPLIQVVFAQAPVIRLKNLMVREVAIDPRAIFLVSTSQEGPEMYEIVCESPEEKTR